MSKQLSSGLLNLRFMQNAQRAKQQAQLEAEQAKVKDEAEWSVPQAVKDAWGIGTASETQSSNIIHEASYVPFLFSSSADDSGESPVSASSSMACKLKGRRTFNARGQEVISDATLVVKEEPGEHIPQEPKDGAGGLRRPKTISGFRAPISTTKSKEVKRTKTAQMLIREDTARAPLDLSASRPELKPSSAPPTGFLKPSGVDAPSTSAASSSASSSVYKRGREEPADPTIKEEKRRKKKKKELS